jgi:hypothetical protein
LSEALFLAVWLLRLRPLASEEQWSCVQARKLSGLAYALQFCCSTSLPFFSV